MSTTRYLTAARLDQLKADLTPRELSVLRFVATTRVATTADVARAVFATAEPASALPLARRHLLRLGRFGLLRRFVNKWQDRRVGPPGYLYALSPGGLRLVGRPSTSRQRSAWKPSDAFVAHRLGITRLCSRLLHAQDTGGPTVRELLAEPDCWRRWTGIAGQGRTLKPDALVRLETAGREISWFVEIDRGSEDTGVIAGKCREYVTYARSGAEQRRHHGIFPGVLFVVPSERRRAAIASVIASQPLEANGLFAAAVEVDALAVLAGLEVAL